MKRSLLREQFVHQLTASQQQILITLLCDACRYFLTARRSVYLEGFGILEFYEYDAHRSYFADASQVSRIESVLSVRFHKCGELTSYHRDQYRDIVEMRELSQFAYANLPIDRAAVWSNRELRMMLAGLIETVKHETVSQGCSTRIAPLGTLYALHNRQGSSFSDWFAGADIFLKSAFERTVRCRDSRITPRPVVENAKELAAALYGEAILTQPLSPLVSLDGGQSPLQSLKSECSVSVFHFNERSQSSFLYLTDGIRYLTAPTADGQISSGSVGVEFALQTSADSILADEEPPRWPFDIMSHLWKMVAERPADPPSIGALVPVAPECAAQPRVNIAAFIISDFVRFHREQLSDEGPFLIRNIVGITADELRLAQESSSQHLLACLIHRNSAQVTKISRSSVLSRSSLFGSGASARDRIDTPTALPLPTASKPALEAQAAP